jgi:FtsH-binding integral membrane protein
VSRQIDDALLYRRSSAVRRMNDVGFELNKETEMTNRTRRRIATVALAPAAALAAWALIRLIGVDLVVSVGNGKVGPGNVVVAALLGALLGWSAAYVFEQRSRRPRLWWSFAASTGLSVSMIGPSWLADGSSAVALMALHFVTAIVVIVGLAGTIPFSGRPKRRPMSLAAG